MLTQQYLKEALDYNPETGIFTWKERPKNHFPCERIQNSTNARYAGKEAGQKRSDSILIGVLGKKMRAHRLAWLIVFGRLPVNMIDHIDGNPLNNRLNNLREATNSQNLQNQRPRKNNILGVHYHLATKKYRATIKKDGTIYHIGLFQTKEDAYAAYLAKKREIHEFCTI